MIFFALIAIAFSAPNNTDIGYPIPLYDHTIYETELSVGGIPNYFIADALRQKELWTAVKETNPTAITKVFVTIAYELKVQGTKTLAACIGRKEDLPTEYNVTAFALFNNNAGDTFCDVLEGSTAGSLTITLQQSYDKYYIATYVKCSENTLCIEEDFIIDLIYKDGTDQEMYRYDTEPYVVLPNKDFRYSTEFTYGGADSQTSPKRYVIYTPAEGDKYVYYSLEGSRPPTLFYTTNLDDSCAQGCLYSSGSENGFINGVNVSSNTPIKFSFQGSSESKISVKISDGTDAAPSLIIALFAIAIFFMF